MPEYTLFNTTLQAPTSQTNYVGQRIQGRTFSASVPGYIVGVRYFRDSLDTSSPHIGRLWDKNTQTELLSVTYQSETASGWQEQRLATPYFITANTVYVVSVNLSTRVSRANPPANAFINNYLSSVIATGSFNFSSSGFPTDHAGNLYFVDIIFVPAFNGSIQVIGNPSTGQILTAALNDLNGVNPSNISYQWQRSLDNGSTWGNITGGTSPSLLIPKTLFNTRLRVLASYTDLENFSENLISSATATITNVNNPGILAIIGIPLQGQVLTTVLQDGDGLGVSPVTYQWQSSSNNGSTWQDIDGAESSELLLTNDLVGKLVKAQASYTDFLDGVEVVSSATVLILNTNDTGQISLIGSFIQGSTITTSITDIDNGVDQVLHYFWQYSIDEGANWQTLPNEMSSSIYLSNSVVGKQLRVIAIYNDELGTREAVTSSASTAVANVNDPGTILIVGQALRGEYLEAILEDIDPGELSINYYEWQQSSDFGTTWDSISNSDSPTLYLNANLVGKKIRVVVSYEDGSGNTELLNSSPTDVVTSTNVTGSIIVAGSPIKNQVLTAVVNDIDGTSTITYQWQSSTNGTDWTNISGATNSTLLLNTPLIGKRVRAIANYTDDLGTSESLTSSATDIVTSTNITGSIIVAGSPIKNQVLTAVVTDIDGTSTISYQWQSTTNGIDWINISGATSSTLLLTSSLIGNQIRAIADYTDALGTSESLTSSATSSITSTNIAGSIIIAGSPIKGQVLTAVVNDVDGADTIDFLWQSSIDGTSWLSSGFDSTLLLTNSFIGKRVRVKATYIDELGTSENLTSSPTDIITNTNSLGSIIIAGSPVKNQVLTAVVNDVDGTSTITYQWQSSTNGADWTNIGGATSSTLLLNMPLIGKRVRAIANYTDNLGTNESLTSLATDFIETISTVGTIAILGNPTRNEVLTAQLSNLTGVDTISYQWIAQDTNGNWSSIVGASDTTLTLTKPLVGRLIRVFAEYLDDEGISQSIISSPTEPVANINTQGIVTISGNPVASTSLTAIVEDEDGVIDVEISYQWQVTTDEGITWENIENQTSSTLFLTAPLVNKQVRAIAEYIDNLGSVETIYSDPTELIAPSPDNGVITITGIVRQYRTLSTVIDEPNGINLNSLIYSWEDSEDGTNWDASEGEFTSTLYLSQYYVNSFVRVRVNYTTFLGNEVEIFSSPTARVLAALPKSSMVLSSNPYELVVSTNTVFTFKPTLVWEIDEETGNSIPSESTEMVLCTATMKQKKDPYSTMQTVQAGVDYNRMYFEGYLSNPKVSIDAQQSRNVPTVINGRAGIFDFIPVVETVEEIAMRQRDKNGQWIAGYFRFT